MCDSLRALVDIICSETAILQAAYAKQSAEVPTLDAPFEPGPLEFDPALSHVRHLIVAAAAQLIATVQSPIEFLQLAAPAMFESAALGFVVDVNIPDILGTASPQGLHVKELSATTGIDSAYIARIMRYLATRHIFKETAPNVFSHNRLSSLLKKAKSLEQLKADPKRRFDDAPFASIIHGFADESLASSAMLSSWLKQPLQAPAAFNMVYKTPKKMWDWLEEPSNEWRARRFTAGMKGGADMFPQDIFINGIDGSTLKADDIIVDIGGSIGSATLVVKKAFPQLRYVVQDLEKQIVAGQKFWEQTDPDAINSGRVQLQVHDFFTPQPIQRAAVYFLRVVIHDWSDEDAHKILLHLRNAAGPSSKLVIFDSLARYTCEDPNLEGFDFPKAPYPLLANLGIGGEGFFTALDLNMMTLFNGKERTQDDFTHLGKEAGWKLDRVKPGMLTTFTFLPI
ncbi:hypothetical protein GYMLUDRAFT_265005 [Collybiopsis luxurians FD-317 M1]|uniref:S-adenosyl-L-methionine-dependent methyltransferase n=1 Tax=Collybiopsis luxurians FD-317 M1 TaxID=944289 RepID=A0A0D0BV70_9AGAR|nr:hypothetical protein GYMLUDRAFT_265005 [Collybiopsis luxurians FD-317 M1]